jgi:4-amino-4-deoxy-L-arabinose transferase-like glycosyltransferase
MINFLKKYWLLIIILLLATFLRFNKLSTYPALNADEASNAYDAYSLIKTGMDQHGHPWPITFESFNDYKPGLYVYLDLPFIKFMGLNEEAARIPGAAAGVLSVLVIYLLTIELFKNRKLAYISALFLAISPWDIQFSRGGWEVNVATLFMLLGVYLFLVFIRSKKFWYLISCILLLGLSLYTYHAPRVIVPLLGIAVLFIYKKEIFIKQNTKKLITGVMLGLIVMVPLAIDLAAPGALSRVAGVGLFADQGPINRIDEQRGEYGNPSNKIGIILHNKVVNYGLEFAENWASHFSGEFLFMTGDVIQRNKVPDMGEMYLFDIIFLIVGVTTIAKTFSGNKKSYLLIISWLLIAPIPSAMTFQAPNALRAENMVIPLIIISSIGCYQIIGWLNGRKVKILKISGLVILALLIIWNFARYQHMYWDHMSKEYPYSSQYGLPELVTYVAGNQSGYQNILVTNRYDQPYILFLFYMKYPPQEFQFHHVLTTQDEFGFSTVADFDKYHFGPIDFSTMQRDYPDSLIVGTPTEIPQSANIVKRIYGTNGFEYFDVVQN